jgi:hypothetical protein
MEKHVRARLVSHGGAGQGRMMCVRMVCRNLTQSLTDPRLSFVVYFCYESVSNTF